MKRKLTYPLKVHEVENAWIPLADGTQLAVRYWLPENAMEHPVPAILEYYPYRKRDHTAVRDETLHPYFAAHGYCAMRVDMRGSGESGGILQDEYLKQEQDDALEVIAWIAAQPWCSGRVGMMGKSWGGFNALQVAARNPPALKCIITLCSTDDRYADDVHYMGGCLLSMNIDWAFRMFCRNVQPPDSRYVGERWRAMWQERLEAARPWVKNWLEHQRRDDYWKHASVCEDYSSIRCPVYAIGGWADGYSNAIPRLLSGLQVPRKGLIGPWGHQYPHRASPGPRIGFLQEALRWWNHWLKDIDVGLMDEPLYRVWLQDSVAPSSNHIVRPGRWVAEAAWPSPRIQMNELLLDAKGLVSQVEEPSTLTQKCSQTVGVGSLQWMTKGTADGAAEDPDDQRIDDCRCLCFDSVPLTEDLEILGAPIAFLDLAVDRPVAFVCARLCDVRPDGASTRVTYGLLNLTHDSTHEMVIPVTPGERRRVEVQMNDAAHRFPAGHRVRLAVSTSFWPSIWPSPEPVELTLHTGTSRLRLPIRPRRDEDVNLRPFEEAEVPVANPMTTVRPPSAHNATVERDVATGRTTVRDAKDSGLMRIDRDGWEFGTAVEYTRSIVENDPLSARMDLSCEARFRRAGQLDVRIEASSSVTADHDSFIVKTRLDAYDDDQPILARSWLDRIPRDGL